MTGLASPRDGSADLAGLYVHVPFCSAICPYCDFAVQVGNAAKRRRYVDALCAEIQVVSQPWQALGVEIPAARNVGTIYFGGGTPSFLEPDELARTLDALRFSLPVTEDARIFLEANPEDVNSSRLEAWLALGVSTLTLGVQAFDEQDLKFLGRRHSTKDASYSIEAARSAGFSTLSIDLIYGLPGQSTAAWQRTLEQAVALEPDHLSCYELEIHPRTTFGKQVARGALRPMPDDAQAELFVTTHRWLADHGYQGYELSNFARSDGHQSRHNRKYWDHTPYLGIGPSSHSFAGRERWWNEPSFTTWQRLLDEERSPRGGSEILTPDDLVLERLMMALRTRDGIDLAAFRESYGCDLLRLNTERISRYVESGLLDRQGDFLRPTLEGWIVADALAAELVVTSPSTANS